MFDQSHVGRRVIYKTRSGAEHEGTIAGVIEGTKFVNVHKEGSSLQYNYQPFDVVRLLDEDTS